MARAGNDLPHNLGLMDPGGHVNQQQDKRRLLQRCCPPATSPIANALAPVTQVQLLPYAFWRPRARSVTTMRSILELEWPLWCKTCQRQQFQLWNGTCGMWQELELLPCISGGGQSSCHYCCLHCNGTGVTATLCSGLELAHQKPSGPDSAQGRR